MFKQLISVLTDDGLSQVDGYGGASIGISHWHKPGHQGEGKSHTKETHGSHGSPKHANTGSLG